MKLCKDISHPSHPPHQLKFRHTKTPFRCDGCKEPGIGLKYKCSPCKFDLHETCALAASTIRHPFHGECEFLFHKKLPPGSKSRICNACQKDVLGFVYHCSGCSLNLHPLCATLPQVPLKVGERNFHLRAKLSSSCFCCGRKGHGWSYQSQCKNYNLHVACAKKLWEESWLAIYLNVDKNKMREIQIRIPSIKDTLKNHHKGIATKVRKCCKVAASLVRIIVSAILGDPTAMIVTVVGAFISK